MKITATIDEIEQKSRTSPASSSFSTSASNKQPGIQLTKENERLLDSYCSFFKNFDHLFSSFHLQHLTNNIMGIDKTKSDLQKVVGIGAQSVPSDRDPVKILGGQKSGIHIYERKINIDPDQSLKIIGVQGNIYTFYSSKTDQTAFYQINFEAQLDAPVIEPKLLAVFNGQISTFIHQEDRFVIDSDVYRFSLDKGLEFIQSLEYVYYDNAGKIKVD